MEEKGLLKSIWKKKTGKRNKRIYYITKEGENLLKTRLKIMKKRIKLLEQMVTYYNNVFLRKES